MPEKFAQRSHRAHTGMQLSQTTHTHVSSIHIAFEAALGTAHVVAVGSRLACVLKIAIRLVPGKEDSPSGARESALINFCPESDCEVFASPRLNAGPIRLARSLAASLANRGDFIQKNSYQHSRTVNVTVRIPHPIPRPNAIARPAAGHRFLKASPRETVITRFLAQPK